ncbi:MAG: HNH endonuclease [Verrucomicrobia bacterium]|nr:HNH endonuclease [Verrucomicrobiota bacterium]
MPTPKAGAATQPSEPSRTTVKRLYAVSHNRCAFPACDLPIVELTGTVTGIICHICARSKGGPRYDSKQTDEQRHDFDNLILLCGRHSKVIDSEPKLYTVERLREMKQAHQEPARNDLSVQDGKNITNLLISYRDIYLQASQIYIGRLEAAHATIHNAAPSKGRRPVEAPAQAIGSHLAERNYIKHLIKRYNSFAPKQRGRVGFKHSVIYVNIEKRFGVDKWELINIEHFAELCEMLQERIDRTQLGSINKSKGIKNYSTFDEYRIKYRVRS